MIVCDLCRGVLPKAESERPNDLINHGDYCKDCNNKLLSALNGEAIIVETYHLDEKAKANLNQEIKTILLKYPSPVKEVKIVD